MNKEIEYGITSQWWEDFVAQGVRSQRPRHCKSNGNEWGAESD